MADYLQNLLSDAVGIARGYVGSGVRISVATNYTGEIPVASAALGNSSSTDAGGSDRSGVVSRIFGLRAAVIVRNARGDVISTLGERPPVDPVRALVALAVAGGLVWLLVRGATR